jgi:hypothetical protein
VINRPYHGQSLRICGLMPIVKHRVARVGPIGGSVQ